MHWKNVSFTLSFEETDMRHGPASNGKYEMWKSEWGLDRNGQRACSFVSGISENIQEQFVAVYTTEALNP